MDNADLRHANATLRRLIERVLEKLVKISGARLTGQTLQLVADAIALIFSEPIVIGDPDTERSLMRAITESSRAAHVECEGKERSGVCAICDSLVRLDAIKVFS